MVWSDAIFVWFHLGSIYVICHMIKYIFNIHFKINITFINFWFSDDSSFVGLTIIKELNLQKKLVLASFKHFGLIRFRIFSFYI